jgi:DNA replication protein DnaC
MIRAVGEFCRDMKAGTNPRWLSLLGSSGAGKTFLAKRVWNWYRTTPMFEAATHREEASGRDEVVYPGQFCWWPEIAGDLAGNQGYDRLVELQSERFVVFDELGADRDPSGHIRNCLARTLCARVGKWTLITSNKTLEEIGDEIDTRIASRIVRDGSQAIDVQVPDFSLRK